MNWRTLWLIALIVVALLRDDAALDAAEPSDVDSILRNVGSFAMGGVGVAGTMSEGERTLREVLKHSDAVARLKSMLPQASAAGQLYALLGLRARDRDAYRQALAKYGHRDISVQTMRGCILQHEAFRGLVKQIDHGDYDSFLSRSWPEPATYPDEHRVFGGSTRIHPDSRPMALSGVGVVETG